MEYDYWVPIIYMQLQANRNTHSNMQSKKNVIPIAKKRAYLSLGSQSPINWSAGWSYDKLSLFKWNEMK